MIKKPIQFNRPYIPNKVITDQPIPKLLSCKECEQFAKEHPEQVKVIFDQMHRGNPSSMMKTLDITIKPYKSIEYALFLLAHIKNNKITTIWSNNRAWKSHQDVLSDIIQIYKILCTIYYNSHQFISNGYSLNFNHKYLWRSTTWSVYYKDYSLNISSGIDIGSSELYSVKNKCNLILPHLANQIRNFIDSFKIHEPASGMFNKLYNEHIKNLCNLV